MRPDRPRWPETVRLAARRMRTEDRAMPLEIKRRLQREHGVDVPLSTVKGWLATREPDRAEPTISDLAARTLALSSQELKRIERASPSKVDLDRVLKVAQILKTIEPLTRARKGASGAARTLADLSEPEGAGAGEPGGVRRPDLNALSAVG